MVFPLADFQAIKSICSLDQPLTASPAPTFYCQNNQTFLYCNYCSKPLPSPPLKNCPKEREECLFTTSHNPLHKGKRGTGRVNLVCASLVASTMLEIPGCSNNILEFPGWNSLIYSTPCYEFHLDTVPKESRQHKTKWAMLTSSLFILQQSDMWERTQIPPQSAPEMKRILTQTEMSHTYFWFQSWGHILCKFFPNMLQDSWQLQVKKCGKGREITHSEERIPLCLDTLPMDLLAGAQDYSVFNTCRIISERSQRNRIPGKTSPISPKLKKKEKWQLEFVAQI